MPPTTTIYTLKIALAGIRPAIWRELQVPAEIPLSRLHDAIQVAMGWSNTNLHEFTIDGETYGVPDDEGVGQPDHDEAAFTLGDLVSVKDSFAYVYDFGDAWEHIVTVEDVAQGRPEIPIRCTDGQRACPPEDCGGPPRYQRLLEIAPANTPAGDGYQPLAP